MAYTFQITTQISIQQLSTLNRIIYLIIFKVQTRNMNMEGFMEKALLWVFKMMICLIKDLLLHRNIDISKSFYK